MTQLLQYKEKIQKSLHITEIGYLERLKPQLMWPFLTYLEQELDKC